MDSKMKNKTKAQLIEEIAGARDDIDVLNALNSSYISSAEFDKHTIKIISDDRDKGWMLLLNQHKKVKRLKRIVKRDTKEKKEMIVSNEKTLILHGKLMAELYATERISENKEQNLQSRENDLNESNQINRYLEQRVQDLTIMLHEAERCMK